MADKVIKLSRTYAAHGQTFDSITLREPKSRDYLEIGDPVEMHSDPSGGDGRFVVEHLDRIKAYAQRLPIHPTPESLVDLDLVDAIAMKEAICDFFLEARMRRNAQTSSSGGQESRSETSES